MCRIASSLHDGVMPGLGSDIHPVKSREAMDCRIKPGNEWENDGS
jgi:hypothetical protein